MDPQLLHAFAARSVGLSLEEFTRDQRVPRDRVRAPRRHRLAASLGTTLGFAAPAVAVVVLVAR